MELKIHLHDSVILKYLNNLLRQFGFFLKTMYIFERDSLI